MSVIHYIPWTWRLNQEYRARNVGHASCGIFVWGNGSRDEEAVTCSNCRRSHIWRAWSEDGAE